MLLHTYSSYEVRYKPDVSYVANTTVDWPTPATRVVRSSRIQFYFEINNFCLIQDNFKPVFYLDHLRLIWEDCQWAG